MEQYNENGSIFVLLHKIDKIDKSQLAKKIELKEEQINEVISSYKVKVKKFFATCIWDESLYQAWSEIVQLLLPNR